MKTAAVLLLILLLTLVLVFLPWKPKPAPTPETAVPETTETLPESRYRDGVYTAGAEDFKTTVTVTVTIEGGQILDIQAEQEEGPSRQFEKAREKLIPWILQDQQTGTDVVTGATYSSEALIAAVNRALAQAENP